MSGSMDVEGLSVALDDDDDDDDGSMPKTLTQAHSMMKTKTRELNQKLKKLKLS